MRACYRRITGPGEGVVRVSEPVMLSWSGGKDSALALWVLARDPAWRVVRLLTTVTTGYDRVSIHGVRRSLLARQAAALGLPVTEVEIPPGCSNEVYEARVAEALARPECAGVRCVAFGDLFLEDVRVPAENLLGGEERYTQREGFKAAMQTFDVTRPTVAAMAVGIGRAAFEYTRDRLREELNLSRPIPRYGVIVERLARMERELHAARLLVWQAASMADQRIPNTKEASMAKAYAGAVATRVCAEAVELLGAAGIRHDRWVEKWFRDIKVFDIFEGTGQVQRLVVARRLFEPFGVRV